MDLMVKKIIPIEVLNGNKGLLQARIRLKREYLLVRS